MHVWSSAEKSKLEIEFTETSACELQTENYTRVQTGSEDKEAKEEGDGVRRDK